MQKAGETVKKTILAAVGMIAMFSFAVFAFSGMMEKQWQTPQQDEINLTAQSPVEMVEKEYKEYGYEIDAELTFEPNEDDTISLDEAVSIGGAVLEKAYPFIDFSNITFSVNKTGYEKIYIRYTYNNNGLLWTVYCYINSRTGYVESYGYGRDTKNEGDAIINDYIKRYKNDTQTAITEDSIFQMEQMGYTDVQYDDIVIIENDQYNILLTGTINGIQEQALYKYWYHKDKWTKRHHIEHQFVLYPLSSTG